MYVRVLKSHHHFFLWSAISNHTGRSVAEGLQQWCSVYTKGIHTHIYMSQGWVFFFFFPRESGEGKQTRLTDMNNSILVGMLQDWLLMVSLKIAERGFLLKAGWPAGWNLSSSSQDLWNLPSPPSRKNTLQILWGNKAWAEQLNQAGSPHWHFLIF